MIERIIFSALIKESDETQTLFMLRIPTLTGANPPAKWKTNAKVPLKIPSSSHLRKTDGCL